MESSLITTAKIVSITWVLNQQTIVGSEKTKVVLETKPSFITTIIAIVITEIATITIAATTIAAVVTIARAITVLILITIVTNVMARKVTMAQARAIV